MGAASGSKIAICNVLRSNAKYNTLDTLEEGYGINSLPLSILAEKQYSDDSCDIFMPRTLKSGPDEDDELLVFSSLNPKEKNKFESNSEFILFNLW